MKTPTLKRVVRLSPSNLLRSLALLAFVLLACPQAAAAPADERSFVDNSIDFGSIPVGGSRDLHFRACNPFGNNAILFVTWGFSEDINQPVAGPFLIFTQRFNLKGGLFRRGECQNVYIRFSPTVQKRVCATVKFTICGSQGDGCAVNYRLVCGTGTGYPVSVSIPGGGRITSEPAGIDCSSPSSSGPNCTREFPSGTVVKLSVTSPPSNPPCSYPFSNWAGDCSAQGNPCTLTVSKSMSAQAGIRAFCGAPPPGPLPPPPPPSGKPPGVSTSGTGGLESAPLWKWHPKEEVRLDTSRLARRPDKSVWPKSSARSNNNLKTLPVSLRRSNQQYSVSLQDVLPDSIPGTSRTIMEPKDVIGNSNAIEAIAADYIEPVTNRIIGSINIFRTVGNVYAHDYALCSRFKGSQLEYVVPAQLDSSAGGSYPGYFWFARLEKPFNGEFVREDAAVFAAHVSDDEHSFEVDSRWISSLYPAVQKGYFLTFQIWSDDAEGTAAMVKQVLAKFGSRGTLSFVNGRQPAIPQVFIARAIYELGEANLTMINEGAAPKKINFTAVAYNAPNAEAEKRFTLTQTVPGGLTVIKLSLPGQLNAVVYADDGEGFLDAVYIADGHWFAFDDTGSGGSSTATWSSKDCARSGTWTSSDLIVGGCAELNAKVSSQGYVGLARALNPVGRPSIDISKYKALTFFAKGDAKSYRVAIETESVAQLGTTDWHQFIFTAPAEWKQVVIPLSDLSQQGWDLDKVIPFTGRDVRAIIWSPIGEPHDTVVMSVDKIGFFNSVVFGGTNILPDTNDTSGPYAVESQVTDDAAVQTASIRYIVNNQGGFNRVPMSGTGDTFSGAIPGQPLNTEIRYYVEAVDADGNVATDPVDAPYSTYRFQVSERPALLIDDFSTGSRVNALGGNSSVFTSGSTGSILTYYDAGALRLVYDVRTAESYAGFSTRLKQADATPYNALTFNVKGAEGGEKIKAGLRDSKGIEHKIIVSQYIADGVSTSWQKVTIPLEAFTTITDRSEMESFVLVVENKLGSANGSIYIDDIKFESLISNPPVVVDNFNDSSNENGVGGSLFKSTGGVASIDTGYDAVNHFGNRGVGYFVSYRGVSSVDWAAAGWSLMGLNASEAKSLSFYIKGAKGGEQAHIYLASGAGPTEKRAFVASSDSVTVTTSWQKVEIDLSRFVGKGVDMSTLSYLQMAFEHSKMEGTVYLDDLRIEWAAAQDLPMITKAQFKSGGKLIISGENFDPAARVYVDGVEVRPKSQDSNRIVVKRPSLLPGRHEARVVNSDGNSATASFEVQ
jgi:hypothetical protein